MCYNATTLFKGYCVRLPRGFGKKGYFSLSAIQASVSEVKAKRQHARLIHTTRLFCEDNEKELSEDDPPPLLLSLFSALFHYRPRVCRCSRLFASRAHSAIKHAQKRRKCNCNCRYFSFRRTGTHPPKFFFLHSCFFTLCALRGLMF